MARILEPEPVAVVEPFDPAQLPVIEAVLGSGGLRKLPRVPRGATWCIRWSARVAPVPSAGMARWSIYGQLGAGQYYNHFPGIRLYWPGFSEMLGLESSSYKHFPSLAGAQTCPDMQQRAG